MEEEIFDTYDFFFNLSINLFNAGLYYILGKLIWRVFLFLLIIPFYNLTILFICTILLFFRKGLYFVARLFERKKKIEKLKMLNNKLIIEYKNWISKEIISSIKEEAKDDSFLSIFKTKSRNYYLTKDLEEPEMEVLNNIAQKGWYFYDSDKSLHRKSVYLVLRNYLNYSFNNLINKYMNRRGYGINFYGAYEQFNVFFYLNNYCIPSYDPIISILYLLIQINDNVKSKKNMNFKGLPFLNK
ncbi:hypothetical protein H311_02271 [Anncaliia algerae PRA109]|nr:hypothetical protein H311_02271 [Anncaliia algerae PRA109]